MNTVIIGFQDFRRFFPGARPSLVARAPGKSFLFQVLNIPLAKALSQFPADGIPIEQFSISPISAVS